MKLAHTSYLGILVYLLFISGCSSKTKNPLPALPAQVTEQFQEYSNALTEAGNSSNNDEFDKQFVNNSTIRIDGESVKSLSRLRGGKDGYLYICDFDRKTVSQFDSQGNYKRSFGNSGNEPGSHVFPTSVVETSDSSIAITDFQSYRVNLFSNSGSFKDSFIYSPQSFSAQDLIFNEANNSFYLFGNKWQTNETGETIGSELLHKYSSDGEYLNSQLQFPDEFKDLGLYNYSSPALDVSSGVIYLVLPFDYTVYRVDPNDELSVFIKANKKDFKQPMSKLDDAIVRSDPHKSVQSWRLHWTPIVGLVATGNELIVQYQTFNPLRYTTDIWSISTKKIKATLKTNHLLLGRDSDNMFYFLKNLDSKEQVEYEIIRAQIR